MSRPKKLSKKASKRLLMYGIAMLLAIINDVLDLAGIGVPMIETLFDAALAILIISALPERKLTDILVALADMFTGIDITPMWTLYLLYRLERDPEVGKILAKLRSSKSPVTKEETQHPEEHRPLGQT